MDANTQDRSLWIATTETTNYPQLADDITVDTVIVGGGIAGISIAYELKARGQRVALVEAGRIVEATTGNTTAKVTSLHGLKYTQLAKKYTDEALRIYAEANEVAIDRIETLTRDLAIDCDFLRLPAYTYAQTAEEVDQVREEAEVAKRLGLPSTYTEDIPLPYKTHGAVKFDNQAHFHVRKYLLALAEHVHGSDSYVFENTAALDITAHGSQRHVVTEQGIISAHDVVVATHEPFYDPDGDYADFFKFHDYALGVVVNDATPQGTFFSTGNQPHSVRYQRSLEGDILVLGGKEEKEKAHTLEEAYELTLKNYEGKFDIRKVLYKWTTYDLATDDGTPYIGQLSRDDAQVFVATGFNGWGMTTGALSGMLLADIITGQPNPWSNFFDKFTRAMYLRTAS